MLRALKNRLSDYLSVEVRDPLIGAMKEVIYQSLFVTHCQRLNLRNDFYPIGSAANYSLMLLLLRILTEHRVQSIVEFGSGQSTMLIDRLRSADATHTCYEHDVAWHKVIAPRLTRCDYRLRSLASTTNNGETSDFYDDVAMETAELVLVDGPIGRNRGSRYGCIPFILNSCERDFLIIIDDVQRPAEATLASAVFKEICSRQQDLARRDIVGAKSQCVIAAGRFAPALYLW